MWVSLSAYQLFTGRLLSSYLRRGGRDLRDGGIPMKILFNCLCSHCHFAASSFHILIWAQRRIFPQSCLTCHGSDISGDATTNIVPFLTLPTLLLARPLQADVPTLELLFKLLAHSCGHSATGNSRPPVQHGMLHFGTAVEDLAGECGRPT